MSEQNPTESVVPPETSVPSAEAPVPVEEVTITPEPAPSVPVEESSVPTPVVPTPVIVPSPPSTSSGQAKSFLAKALEAIQFRKRKKLEKIMKFVNEKGSATNDQIEKLLHVSDATANRYLSQLTREHRLRREGHTSGTVYKLP